MTNSINKDNKVRIALHNAIEEIKDYVYLKYNNFNMSLNIPYIVGLPGGGKSAMSASNLISEDIGFMSCTPALDRLEKFGGIPNFYWVKTDDGETNESIEGQELHTVWSVPEIVSKMRKLSKNFKSVVVLYDDWHLCPANIQQIGFEQFTHHQISGHKIPKNVFFILAGNESSAAGAKVSLTAIKNRCYIIPTYSDYDYWRKNYAIPNNVCSMGVSFLGFDQYRGLFQMPEDASEPFGSARSWTSAFNYLQYKLDKGIELSNDHLSMLFQGHVGNNAAAEFVKYYKIYRHIPVDKIFEEGIIDIPLEPVKRYAFASVVSYEFYNRYVYLIKNVKNVDRKKFEEKLKKYCTGFSKALLKLFEAHEEIAQRAVLFIVDQPERPEEGIRSGLDIFKSLVSAKLIPVEIISKVHSLNVAITKEFSIL